MKALQKINFGYIAAGVICMAVLMVFAVTAENFNGGTVETPAVDAAEEISPPLATTEVADELATMPVVEDVSVEEEPVSETPAVEETVEEPAVEEPVVEEAESSVSLLEVIMMEYSFDERSDRVQTLQELLGGIAVDSHYGNQTRGAHLDALRDAGLDTGHVPSAPKASTGTTIPALESCGDMSEVSTKYVVGDSLSVGVEMTGFVDRSAEACLNLVEYSAKLGRKTSEAEAIVNSWGTLGSNAVVLVALGTNDIWGSQESFVEAGRKVMNAIGSSAQVIWLDVSEDIPNADETRVNNGIAQLATEYSNIQIADWSAYEAAHNVRRASDGVHYNGSQYEKRANYYYDLLSAYGVGSP